MRALTLSLTLLLAALPSAGFAIAAPTNEPGTLAERADARAERITDSAKFIAEVDASVAMARQGDYGPIKKGDLKEVIEARATIKNLLKGHEQATELSPADRIELYNAQELITATLRSDEKNRKICKRAPSTGSRLTKTECMTIAEREARAKAARDLAKDMQRTICNPSETKSCG